MSCPVDSTTEAQCPVQRKGCQSEAINDQNQMKENESQKQWPGQKINLGTDRVVSNIPNANKDGDTWIYPSEQQFFNALKRKGWSGTEENDMKSVVQIHNHVNEMVWMKILEYERYHCKQCPDPKLLKFLGRPQELSPKAFVKSKLLGYKEPFDRHDWVVDRCGEQVRYVIDFYKGAMNSRQKQIGQVGFYVDVRPAIDSFSAMIDRMKHSIDKIR